MKVYNKGEKIEWDQKELEEKEGNKSISHMQQQGYS